MENKILDFQFEHVLAKPTCSSYKFQKLWHFVLKVQQDSWNTAALEFTEAVFMGVFQNRYS